MIDHIGISVSDFTGSKMFYQRALAPLGYTPVMEVTHKDSGGAYEGVGFGREGKPSFWVGKGGSQAPSRSTHIAFLAHDRAAVDAFYTAAISAGGSDNGAPGLRPNYHENYYGAFVLDADGNNIEAVCHAPEPV